MPKDSTETSVSGSKLPSSSVVKKIVKSSSKMLEVSAVAELQTQPSKENNHSTVPLDSTSTKVNNSTKPNDLIATEANDKGSGKKDSTSKTNDVALDLAEKLAQLKVEFDRKYQEKQLSDSSKKLDDYKFLAVLGQGAFGLVKLVKHEPTETFYAVKIVSKEKVIKTRQVNHTLNEKKILSCLNFPFVVCLSFSLKDNSYVYFGMPFVNGGEMFTHLRKAKKFQEDLAKFYAAQIVLALEYIHKMGMVYRDLKPENIMVDHKGFLKMTDFGFCKVLKGRTYTLCGTPEYIAPEIVLNKGYGQSVDWWSFGILVFEMVAGYSPFSVGEPSQMEMMDKIVTGKFKIPPSFNVSLKQLILNLLQSDLTKRFGNLKAGVEDIKSHAWFKKTEWTRIFEQTLKPPFIPKVSGPGDYSQFDKYDDIPLKFSATNQYEKVFEDF